LKPIVHIDSDDVEVKVSYQIDEILHVNEVIKVEKVSKLQDLEVDLKEVEINKVSSFEDQMNEETNEWEKENKEIKGKDDFKVDFDIFSSKWIYAQLILKVVAYVHVRDKIIRKTVQFSFILLLMTISF